tara:strand:- start:80 stop:277 length:198 start_codon:yes stop_codon:yes gene_type:complete
MKSIKASGDPVPQSSLTQRNRERSSWLKRKDQLEKAIEDAKGTPAAKILVRRYREHVKQQPKFLK